MFFALALAVKNDVLKVLTSCSLKWGQQYEHPEACTIQDSALRVDSPTCQQILEQCGSHCQWLITKYLWYLANYLLFDLKAKQYNSKQKNFICHSTKSWNADSASQLNEMEWKWVILWRKYRGVILAFINFHKLS